VETLNELFTEMFEAVAAHDGVLDKYIGDAVMAVYGAPLSSGRDPENALASGLEMLTMLDAINERRAARGAPAMRIGIGIATGEVVAGTIGSPKRMDYTVIGDSVNLAARLQDLTKVYGVEMLVCEKTAAAAAGALGAGGLGAARALREIDLIAVRGRKRPEKVFEVLARPPGDPAIRARMLDAYARGRAAVATREWDAALSAFGEALAAVPDDRPSRLMLARARALAGAPPSELWDGVWRDPATAEAA
ncbi:MAG TPA: adenylate/guanylate cyclase domain-containing protein, partial [Novosphingobium sp.]|nr:adenylate/guanylate cyclase domain-containing protein [Novosphingobium sp.]